MACNSLQAKEDRLKCIEIGSLDKNANKFNVENENFDYFLLKKKSLKIAIAGQCVGKTYPIYLEFCRLQLTYHCNSNNCALHQFWSSTNPPC